MKLKHISITAIACALILGGSYYAVQVNKQNSIEEQQRIELEAEQELLRQEQADRKAREVKYDLCVSAAELDYWEFMGLNGTLTDKGTIVAQDKYWDRADERKAEDIENCYNRYLK